MPPVSPPTSPSSHYANIQDLAAESPPASDHQAHTGEDIYATVNKDSKTNQKTIYADIRCIGNRAGKSQFDHSNVEETKRQSSELIYTEVDWDKSAPPLPPPPRPELHNRPALPTTPAYKQLEGIVSGIVKRFAEPKPAGAMKWFKPADAYGAGAAVKELDRALSASNLEEVATKFAQSWPGVAPETLEANLRKSVTGMVKKTIDGLSGEARNGIVRHARDDQALMATVVGGGTTIGSKLVLNMRQAIVQELTQLSASSRRD